MKIGLPKEIMVGESRIALTPDACSSLLSAGHALFIETGAADSSGYSDDDYQRRGVQITANAAALYSAAEMIVKVKQPLPADLDYLRKDHILFSYLHLAANPELVQRLCEIGLLAIPFEAIQDRHGDLPLLRPMSQIAGRISVIRGASLLFKNRGGRGVLLGGVDGADAGNVVVLGAGVAGSHAVSVAVSLGAQVDVVDLNEQRLQELKKQYPTIQVHRSSPVQVAALCQRADLVIGAVLLAGKRAPIVLTEAMVQKMPAGSVIVDIAIDQGGCVEGIRLTDAEELCYLKHGVSHSAVPNMPAATPRTSSQALATAILPYVKTLAEQGLEDDSLRTAVALQAGRIRDKVLLQEVA